MENIIEIINLSKSFKDTKALDNINLSFEKGKIYGIIGRNGSGKTVLMKCICGFMASDEGSIKINSNGDCKIGIIIETPGFLYSYSGYRNLKLLANLNKKISKQDIIDTITLVGLDPLSKKKVGKYSLGMRQRLGIAQAIMEKPDILILDEPMNGLDNQGVEDMRKLFLKLNKEGKTIILASHNREDISVLCDTVIEMDHGKIINQN